MIQRKNKEIILNIQGFIYTFLIGLELFVPVCSCRTFSFSLKKIDSNVRNVGSNLDELSRVKRNASTKELKTMNRNLNGLSGDGYYIDVQVGTPPQKLQALIDTGSANFAIACQPDSNIDVYFHSVNSSTYHEEGTEIYVPYTEGEWTGVLATDQVSIDSELNISALSNFACIESSRDFYVPECRWQGILGLAYAEIAKPDPSVLPFWDSLLEQHPDVENVFSVLLCGSSFIHTKETPLMKGTLVFGGILPKLSKTDIFYTPIYKEWYYEVVLTAFEVDSTPLDIDCKELNMDKTIVDTGTTNIRLPITVFEYVVDSVKQKLREQNKYNDIPDSFFNGSDGPICYSDMSDAFNLFPVLSFYVYQTDTSSFRLDVTPQHYLRPIANSNEMGDEELKSCVSFGLSPSSTGTVLGAVFMEAFYVVFDRSNSRIGFGQSSCPLPDPGNPVKDIVVDGPFPSAKNLSECAYKKPDDGGQTFLLVTYIMTGISLLILLPLVLMFVFWIRRLCIKARLENYEEVNSLTDSISQR